MPLILRLFVSTLAGVNAWKKRAGDEAVNEELNDRQRKFVDHVARGVSAQEAARLAGYGSSYAKKASRLLQCPPVARELELIRAKARDIASYTLVEAMGEANAAAQFARENKNSMALVKATELRAKLSGLLIERVEIATVDLRASIDGARDRVLKVINEAQAVLSGPSSDAPPLVKNEAGWGAG
jgi:phage terminase small subunit